MGDQRVRIRAEHRLIGWKLPNGRVIVQEPVRPRNKVLPIRSVSVASVMLTPGELAFEKSNIDRRHFGGMIVVRGSEVLRAEQTEHRPRGHGGHVAALLVQPLGITLLRDAVADEGQPRRTQRISSWESTGRSPAFFFPKEASAAPYFRKLPAIQ